MSDDERKVGDEVPGCPSVEWLMQLAPEDSMGLFPRETDEGTRWFVVEVEAFEEFPGTGESDESKASLPPAGWRVQRYADPDDRGVTVEVPDQKRYRMSDEEALALARRLRQDAEAGR
jgi:hypothetical protein